MAVIGQRRGASIVSDSTEEFDDYLKNLDSEARDMLLNGRVQCFGPTSLHANTTASFQAHFAQTVELQGIYVHPDVLESFKVHDVRVGLESLFTLRKSLNSKFDRGFLSLKSFPLEKRILPRLHLVQIMVSTQAEKVFFGTVHARVRED